MKVDVKRSRVRQERLSEFVKRLNALVILDQNLRKFIMDSYMSMITRLSAEDITSESWKDLDRDYIMREYDEVIEQINMLDIFSRSFKYLLYNEWKKMIDTFDPDTYLDNKNS